jgi:hypothetical protein
VSHAFQSKDHTDLKSKDEISYSFVYDAGLTSGGSVTVIRWNESKLVDGPAGKIPLEEGRMVVHKDALIAFVAHLVRGQRISQIEGMNDLQALGV